MSGQYQYTPSTPLGFTLGIIGGFGALTGLLAAQGDVGLMPLSWSSAHFCFRRLDLHF